MGFEPTTHCVLGMYTVHVCTCTVHVYVHYRVLYRIFCQGGDDRTAVSELQSGSPYTFPIHFPTFCIIIILNGEILGGGGVSQGGISWGPPLCIKPCIIRVHVHCISFHRCVWPM